MGNVYRDEAGHFTNKENNGGPCKHKRIAGGKYEYSEDGGKTWNAFEKREDYDSYETDEDERFDETNDDDFGFDEVGDDEAGSPYNEVDYNWVKDHIDDNPGIKAEQLIEDVKDKFGEINPEDEMEIRKIIDEEYNTEMKKAQEEKAAMSEGKDSPAENKVKIGDREMTLDEWNNKMKNASDKEMAREFMLIHAPEFNMSENEMEEYLKNNFDENEETKGNPYDPEDLPDEGMSQEENKPDDFSPYNKNGWKMSRDSAGRLVYGPDDDYFGKSGISFSDAINRSPEEFYKGLKDRFGEKFDQKTRDDKFYDRYYRMIDEHNGYRLYQNPESRRFFIVSPNGEEFGDYRYADKKVNKAIWDDWKANGKYNPYYKKGK